MGLSLQAGVDVFQESQDGVPNLEVRGAQNIHSLDGTTHHPVL